MNKKYNFNDLIDIVAQLRNPDGGCPWDLEQNYKTIVPYTIEEAYEVADAVEREDFQELKSELGDLLFQVIFQAQLATEDKHFTIDDVVQDICEKMVRRHPHVFKKSDAATAQAVEEQWDQIKEQEKGVQASILDDVTKGMPALLYTQKLAKRAAKVGYDWPDVQGHKGKINEELAELYEAIESNDITHIEEELGDVLFCLSNLGRYYKINSEEALRKTATKFRRRFQGMEIDAKENNRAIDTLSNEEWLSYWQKQKEKERQAKEKAA